jgi:S-phase kinase-associated protein 1
MVAIITSDGKMFDISDAIVDQIRMIKNAAEDFCDEIIPIPTVNSDIFSMIVEFCTFKTEEHDFGATEEFVTNFFDVPTDILFDIISASNFLDAPDVLDAACSAAANLLRDKNPDEIRAILNIENKFTPEEEAEIIKENSWAFQPKTAYHQNGAHN